MELGFLIFNGKNGMCFKDVMDIIIIMSCRIRVVFEIFGFVGICGIG